MVCGLSLVPSCSHQLRLPAPRIDPCDPQWDAFRGLYNRGDYRLIASSRGVLYNDLLSCAPNGYRADSIDSCASLCRKCQGCVGFVVQTINRTDVYQCWPKSSVPTNGPVNTSLAVIELSPTRSPSSIAGGCSKSARCRYRIFESASQEIKLYCCGAFAQVPSNSVVKNKTYTSFVAKCVNGDLPFSDSSCTNPAPAMTACYGSSPCYSFNEGPTKGRCENSCECDGLRTCSLSSDATGFCQGLARTDSDKRSC